MENYPLISGHALNVPLSEKNKIVNVERGLITEYRSPKTGRMTRLSVREVPNRKYKLPMAMLTFSYSYSPK